MAELGYLRIHGIHVGTIALRGQLLLSLCNSRPANTHEWHSLSLVVSAVPDLHYGSDGVSRNIDRLLRGISHMHGSDIQEQLPTTAPPQPQPPFFPVSCAVDATRLGGLRCVFGFLG